MAAEADTPQRLAGLALSLPFRRFGALILCARLTLGTWIVGLLCGMAIIAWQTQSPLSFSAGLRFVMLFIALATLLGAAFSGYSLAAGWRRVAAAWPERPGTIPLYSRESGPRPFSLLTDPLGFLLQLVTVVPVAALCLIAITGAYLADTLLGTVFLALLPIIPLSFAAAVESPQQRALRPQRSFRFRVMTHAFVIGPAWLLAFATVGIVILSLEAAPLMAAPLILIAAIFPLILCIAWYAATGALLEGRRRSEAAVFD